MRVVLLMMLMILMMIDDDNDNDDGKDVSGDGWTDWYCIVLSLSIYIALLTVRAAQKPLRLQH